MTTALSWVMVKKFTVRYLLVDNVLVVVDADRDGNVFAVANEYKSATEAHDRAVRYTEVDEIAGYLMTGEVRRFESAFSPDTIVTAYRDRRPLGAMLRVLLDEAQQGVIL